MSKRRACWTAIMALAASIGLAAPSDAVTGTVRVTIAKAGLVLGAGGGIAEHEPRLVDVAGDDGEGLVRQHIVVAQLAQRAIDVGQGADVAGAADDARRVVELVLAQLGDGVQLFCALEQVLSGNI